MTSQAAIPIGPDARLRAAMARPRSTWTPGSLASPAATLHLPRATGVLSAATLGLLLGKPTPGPAASRAAAATHPANEIVSLGCCAAANSQLRLTTAFRSLLNPRPIGTCTSSSNGASRLISPPNGTPSTASHVAARTVSALPPASASSVCLYATGSHHPPSPASTSWLPTGRATSLLCDDARGMEHESAPSGALSPPLIGCSAASERRWPLGESAAGSALLRLERVTYN
jgi:hypothetical protein